jgi:L-asparaginase
LTGEDLLAAIPGLSHLGAVVPTSFRQFPSGDLRVEDIIELAALIEKRFADGLDGVVVTQGTDTLEETAFLLDLMLTADRPVVLTGAMRHAGLAGADGPANILAAVRVAVSPEASGLGPLVVVNDEVHLARYVRKMHTSSTAAFQSPGLGPIGWVSEDRVRIPLIPRHRTDAVVPPVEGLDGLPRVALLKVGLGSDEALVDAAAKRYDGLVIEGFGGGHVPQAIVESMKRASSRIPVIFASRIGTGELYRNTYEAPGSETHLLDIGIISAGNLDGNKARLLLILLLSSGRSRDEIQHRFYQAVA